MVTACNNSEWRKVKKLSISQRPNQQGQGLNVFKDKMTRFGAYSTSATVIWDYEGDAMDWWRRALDQRCRFSLATLASSASLKMCFLGILKPPDWLSVWVWEWIGVCVCSMMNLSRVYFLPFNLCVVGQAPADHCDTAGYTKQSGRMDGSGTFSPLASFILCTSVISHGRKREVKYARQIFQWRSTSDFEHAKISL